MYQVIAVMVWFGNAMGSDSDDAPVSDEDGDVGILEIAAGMIADPLGAIPGGDPIGAIPVLIPDPIPVAKAPAHGLCAKLDNGRDVFFVFS